MTDNPLSVTVEWLFREIDDPFCSHFKREPTGERQVTVNGYTFSPKDSEALMPLVRDWAALSSAARREAE